VSGKCGNPCGCGRVSGPVYDPGQCRLCWLYAYDARYRNLWDRTPTPGVPDVPVMVAAGTVACRHLGKEPVGLRDCPTCAGRVRLKTFRCALGLGVAGEAVPSVDCGPQCSGFSPGG
jgi:hypothetical protein